MTQKLIMLFALIGLITYVAWVTRNPPVQDAWGETFDAIGAMLESHWEAVTD